MTNRSQAFRKAVLFIEQKDSESLNQLLGKYSDLLHNSEVVISDQPLIHHTLSYANFSGDEPDFWSTPECADILKRHGAVIDAKFCLRALSTADFPMIEWLRQENELPVCLRVVAALGQTKKIKNWLLSENIRVNTAPPTNWLRSTSDPLHYVWKDQNGELTDKWLIADALRYAIRFSHKSTAKLLLEQLVEIDQELCQRIKGKCEPDFLSYMIQHRSQIIMNDTLPAWEMYQLIQAEVAVVNGDMNLFQYVVEETPSLLSRQFIRQQVALLELAAYSDGYLFAKLLLDSGAYIGKTNSRPNSNALVYAIEYGNREMVELLKDLWTPPYDLPTLAGLGDLSKVKTYLDHQVNADLSAGLALACMNQHKEIANYLIDQGADINAEWSLHEPATILHHLAFFGKLDMVQFLIERGADPTIKDFRYQSDALGWAEYNGQDNVVVYLRHVIRDKQLRVE